MRSAYPRITPSGHPSPIHFSPSTCALVSDSLTAWPSPRWSSRTHHPDSPAGASGPQRHRSSASPTAARRVRGQSRTSGTVRAARSLPRSFERSPASSPAGSPAPTRHRIRGHRPAWRKPSLGRSAPSECAHPRAPGPVRPGLAVIRRDHETGIAVHGDILDVLTRRSRSWRRAGRSASWSRDLLRVGRGTTVSGWAPSQIS